MKVLNILLIVLSFISMVIAKDNSTRALWFIILMNNFEIFMLTNDTKEECEDKTNESN